MKLNNWIVPALMATVLLFVGDAAWAADGPPNEKGLTTLAAGIAMGLAALGGTLGQSNAARATFEAIGRNPQVADKVFTPFIIGMALIESLVIVAFVLAFLLQGKVVF